MISAQKSADNVMECISVLTNASEADKLIAELLLDIRQLLVRLAY